MMIQYSVKAVGLWCCLLLAIGTVIDAAPEPETIAPMAFLKDGPVEGRQTEAFNGKKVNYFLGIRYGEAERFEKSQPVKPWTGIYDASKPRDSCPQPAVDPSIGSTSEDCLFLNVWNPDSPNGPISNLSVIVVIHGVGFSIGSIFNKNSDAKEIVALGDVVVVAISYRLGPLGFASFGTKNAPGNLGLHDQILALKWVQKNIEHFGGNPADVTLYGGSAGSMSVGTLILSPLTTGLFHRAIMQSGAPNSRYLWNSQQENLHKTLKLGSEIGCNVTNYSEDSRKFALNCMKKKSIDDIVKHSYFQYFKDSIIPLYGDELLPVEPWIALKQLDRPIDLLFGLCANEGALFLEKTFLNFNLTKISLEKAKEDVKLILKDLHIPSVHAKLLNDHYTKDLTKQLSPNDLRVSVSNVYGDYFLVCPTVLFGEQLARQLSSNSSNPKSNHFYSYRVMLPVQVDVPSNWKDWMGLVHGLDQIYSFGIPLKAKAGIFTKEQIQLSRDIITSFTEFAKTGRIPPVSGTQWTEALANNSSSVSYFYLDPDNYQMVHNYWNETCDTLWRPVLSD